MSTEMTVDVKCCQRCGQNHSQLKFGRLSNPTDEWRWWALCPVNRQPILLKVEKERKP